MSTNSFIKNISVIIKGSVSFIAMIVVAQYFTLLIFIPLPLKKAKRKLFYKKQSVWFARFILKTHLNIKTIFFNPFHEDFTKPAVVVVNHQTILDAITISSISHKFALITNDFMKRTIFRFLIRRYIDNISTDHGTEILVKDSEKMITKGYYPVMYPEGPRTFDNKINRFHKGAFYLAAVLQVDIIPVVVSADKEIMKKKWFYFKKGTLQVYIGKRFSYCNTTNNEDIKLQAKNVKDTFRKIYANLQAGIVPE